MIEHERYVLSIQPCHGVTDDAMASMLSSWVTGTVHSQQWLTQDAIHALITNHPLKGCDIEKMAVSVLDALDGCGLYSHLLMKVEDLDLVTCQVKGNLAYLELEWKKRNESAYSYPTA